MNTQIRELAIKKAKRFVQDCNEEYANVGVKNPGLPFNYSSLADEFIEFYEDAQKLVE